MSVYERLLQPENLNYAWIKAKNLYRTADSFIDAAEIAAFEIDLERRLLDIRRQFERGTYRLKKLRPLPRPKKISEERPINRQYYYVAIEDQIAWIAMVNALGPELDLMMEPWSYGNRLYRAAWYEKDEARGSTLEIGPYRHASGHLYRKFQHSWPLFRRHITLTARMMVLRRTLQREEMDEPDQLAAVTAERAKLAYFLPGFWQQKSTSSSKSDLYHASIDLKQFYPELNIEAVVKGLAEAGAMADQHIAKLVKSMLNFQINMAGMPETALENVEPPFLKGSVKGIPTGLFVSGFLANAAMLPVDRIVAREIRERRDIAHFRFVDDHTLLAYNFDALCDWIIWYERLLEAQGIGPVVNADKSDPPSISEWIKHLKSGVPPTTKNAEAYSLAIRETRLDGKNPTKLMTKTLAQVSAIAATDIHILDDQDLGERLKMLEWLLLADIPEREIRPDTRAAFAAGQIASLVPVLVQEADGLVEAAREVAAHKMHQPNAKQVTEDDLRQYEERLIELQNKLRACIEEHDKAEIVLLNRCFALLLQSLREHPGKARLFYRIHQYCQITGHRGLKAIAEWLHETRAGGQETWADYYISLSLQIMANGILTTVRRLTAPDAMQSDIKAAANHLDDIARLDAAIFRVPAERETWYHATGRREFGVALIQATEVLALRPGHEGLAGRLAALSQKYVSVKLGALVDTWLGETGWTPGVWAHLAEGSLGGEISGPSAAWLALTPYFAFDQRLDLQAARRYPEWLPEAGWKHLIAMTDRLPENDSAWLREVIGNDESRRAIAQATGKKAFTRAARSLEAAPEHWMTMSEWTESVNSCNPFDPRRGEWTALDIAAQLLEEATLTGGDDTILDRLHPNNVLLPRKWISASPCHRDWTELSWEDWRRLVHDGGDRFRARLRDARSSLADYRYSIESKIGIPIPIEERRLVSVGRLLLGLLRNDHTAPRIWNLRGNEMVFRLPRARWFEMLAISSPTTLILEACLGARPAETRAITREPSLFGWHDGEHPNDATFDPPTFYSSTDLLEGIRSAQKILEDNQLAVARNQPRQLIPFRLVDFAAGTEGAGATSSDGGSDGE